jgi:hypothetical protein
VIPAAAPAAIAPSMVPSAPGVRGSATTTPTSPGTPAQDALRAGLGFERVLLGELARTMTQGSGLGGDAAGVLAAQLPDVLADAVAAGGGIGLASALAPGLEERPR